MVSGKAVGRASGKWQVHVGERDTPSGALVLFDRVQALGLPAKVKPIAAGDSYRYQILVRHLGSESEALALANNLKLALGLPDVAATAW
jgi:hypothetical protein